MEYTVEPPQQCPDSLVDYVEQTSLPRHLDELTTYMTLSTSLREPGFTR